MHQDSPAFPVAEDHKTADSMEWTCGLSTRAYAAIQLRVPDSGEQWLDEMIRKARRDDFAKAAISGMTGTLIGDDVGDELAAFWCKRVADAIIGEIDSDSNA